MLTRLKISGFKNLVDVDIRFGAFTCIAGPNAVGKSNLFDAIRFLSYLSNDTLLNAALSVRSEGGRTGDIRSLFHHVGSAYDDKISFEAEMIIPKEDIDDLGQTAIGSTTLVRYRVTLRYREGEDLPSLGSLELFHESLEHINLGDAPRLLLFPNSPEWRKSVIAGRRTSPFISTTIENHDRVIKLSQDGKQGRTKSFLATRLPRTVLSTVNAAESPTALLTKREMQSWQMLQLEPSAMREPDNFTTPPGLQPNGAHLSATLYHLARTADRSRTNGWDEKHSQLYDRVAYRLSQLLSDIYEVSVDRDDKRELLTLQVTERDGTTYPARSLSDGTLRFLALTTIDLDPSAGRLLCMEEPENGIHPLRIPAMMDLLQAIACDVTLPVSQDNPLRQVIINTHSPVVVHQAPDDSLLVALTKEMLTEGKRFKTAKFSWLPDTWRSRADPGKSPVSKGDLLAYLNPVGALSDNHSAQNAGGATRRRVIDRPDMRQLVLPMPEPDNE